MKPVSIAIAGAGNRGTGYADFILQHPHAAKVVAVAEPREYQRTQVATRHGIAPENVMTDWRELAARPRLADAVIIATQDAMHMEPALAFAAKGYHMLLEKPLAPNEADCRKIVRAAQDAKILFGVCHVLRYTPYTRKFKALVDSGIIGDVVSIDHLEPVGYWHQAHSFVRGNWRNEAESSSMLLAKSCHDLDWLRHIMGRPCLKVSSFGSLKHFRKEEKPAGAGERCLSCGIETKCPYSAKKIYLGMVAKGRTGWPLEVLTSDMTAEGVTKALETGPYGRCVYACDNDVVDHQVVNMLFEGGRTASFTMTAFNEGGHRKTRIFGTRGALYGDGVHVEHVDFLTDRRETIDTRATDGSILGGHGGGDEGIMEAFLDAVAHQDASRILSGPVESLETHLMVFAAERARKQCTVEDVKPQ